MDTIFSHLRMYNIIPTDVIFIVTLIYSLGADFRYSKRTVFVGSLDSSVGMLIG
jgi:uncharacterized BrkB/YihY/UPF0761 family membrane protein